MTAAVRFALFSLLLFYSFNTFSQKESVFFQNYQVEDGLPSNNVYALASDTSGYLWIATDAGLCRYDGQYFKTYTKKEGLPDIEILDLFLDSQNRLWCNAFNGKIFCLENGTVIRFENFKFPQNQNNSFWSSISESNDGTIHMHNRYTLLSLVVDSTVLVKQQYVTFLQPNGYLSYNVKNNNISKFDYTGDSLLTYTFNERFDQFSILDSFAFIWNEKNLICLKEDGNIYFNLSFSENELNYEIVRPAYIDNTLWLTTSTDGLYEINFSDREVDVKKHLNGNSTTQVVKDKFGNYWIATFGQGIFKYTQNSDEVYNKRNGLLSNDITAFTEIGTRLILGDAQSNIYLIGGDSIRTFNFLSKRTYGQNRIIEIIPLSDNRILVFSDNELSVLDSNKESQLKLGANPYKGALKLNSDSIITLSSDLVSLLDGEKLTVIDSIPLYRASCGAVTVEKDLWVGTANGLYFSKRNDILKFMPYNGIRRDRISDLEMSKTTLCVCTANDGLYLINRDSLIHVTTDNGLVSDHCNSIVLEDESTLWYATNTGLNKITFTENGLSSVELTDTNSGLISNQIKKVGINSGNLIIATPLGLQIINNNNQRKILKSVAYIDQIQVNNEELKWNQKDSVLLERHQNNITFHFSAIDFISSPAYEFRLEGYENNFRTSKNRDASYFNLAPGNYIFNVRTLNQSKGQNVFSQVYVDIEPHFWETFWFKTIVVISIVASTALLLINYRNNRKKRLKLFQVKTEAELKALRAQINPHFLFNALNSIQDVILDQDIVKANSYISKFSKLMRLILDHSKTPYISLEEEINMLELYLSLEKLRFGTNFEARITIDQSISKANTILPSAILQPLVENAIWHGLIRKKGTALLSITFEDHENLTKCAIDDNGIGIKASEKGNALHNSNSLINMKERITLINQNLEHKITYSILDSNEGTIEYPGTRIEIFIPKEIQSLI